MTRTAKADQAFNAVYQGEMGRYCDFSTAIGQAILPALDKCSWGEGLACAEEARAELARACSSEELVVLDAARDGYLEVLAGASGHIAEAAAYGYKHVLGIERVTAAARGTRVLPWNDAFALGLGSYLKNWRHNSPGTRAQSTPTNGSSDDCTTVQHPTLALFREGELDLTALLRGSQELMPLLGASGEMSFDGWALVSECLVLHAVFAGVAVARDAQDESEPDTDLCVLGYVRQYGVAYDRGLKMCQALLGQENPDRSPGSGLGQNPLDAVPDSLKQLQDLLLSIAQKDAAGVRRGLESFSFICDELQRLCAG